MKKPCVVYISSAGKTAALSKNFLSRAKEEYKINAAILLSSSELAGSISENLGDLPTVLILINNALFGNDGAEDCVQRIVSAVVSIGSDVEVIVNTSGGTEKMANIIKAAGSILGKMYKTRHIFGVYNKTIGSVIYTKVKPFEENKILLRAVSEAELSADPEALEE